MKSSAIRNTVAFVPVFLLSCSMGPQAYGQAIKPGLWQSEITTTTAMTLPPEVEARIAALPPERQQMVRSQMGGGKPITRTNESCVAPDTTVDTLLNDETTRNGQMKCTVTNRSTTASGGSFDTNCTGDASTASAHVEYTRIGDEHATGKMHMTIASTPGNTKFNGTSDSTIQYKYLGPDCGVVKPKTGSALPH